MSKKHQYVASGKKTRTGQSRKSRHKTAKFLESFSDIGNVLKKAKVAKKEPKTSRSSNQDSRLINKISSKSEISKILVELGLIKPIKELEIKNGK